MPTIRLVELELPDFGMPTARPKLPDGTHQARLDVFVDKVRGAGLDAAIVYADREHFANMAYLTDFEPRFEEALLLVMPGRTPLLLTGPENTGLARDCAIKPDVITYPPFGLLGQDRTRTPKLADLLKAHGLANGQKIGAAGWKYFGPQEHEAPDLWSELPSFLIDTVRRTVGAGGRVVNINALLMAPTGGLRATNELEQLAQFEFAACHASEAVKRVVFGLRPGLREFEAAQLMRLPGLPVSCHPMLSSGARAYQGLNSPSDKVIERGDPFTTAVGLWGALTSRAGYLVEDAAEIAGAPDYVEKLAAPYFACAAEWYETIGIGVEGGTLDAIARKHLGDPFFNLVLNPGHLIHLDEWLSTPVYPGSSERFVSRQAVQCDIIPATGTAWYTSNIEDGIALLDETDRQAFAERFPEAWARVEARRAFMADALGIRLKPEVLPFSNIPAYLPPLLLSPKRALVRHG
jgi:hypothetical protein